MLVKDNQQQNSVLKQIIHHSYTPLCSYLWLINVLVSKSRQKWTSALIYSYTFVILATEKKINHLLLFFNMHVSFSNTCASSSLCQPSQTLFFAFLAHFLCFSSNISSLLFQHLSYVHHLTLVLISSFYPCLAVFSASSLCLSLYLSLPLSLSPSLRCRMLWAMSCHGSILSLSSSSALFLFSTSFWGC